MSVDVQARLRAALASVTHALGAAGIVSASAEARTLLAHAARCDGPLVLLDALPETFDADLDAAVARRVRREPLQLIVGTAPFRRLSLRTRPGVFIPRPETELAIDVLHAHLATTGEKELLIWDLCTGSGTLGAAVVDELPRAHLVGVELDASAAELARENIASAAHPGAPGTWEVRQGDVTDTALISGLPGADGSVDAILANPPYIPAAAVPRDAEVADWDPHRALYGGGEDGLDVPRAVIAAAARALRPGGLLVMEHADVQGEASRAIAEASGAFEDVETVRDLTGRDRFLAARRARN